MPSPFPGMDPYLESHWGDIHHAVIGYARDASQSHLPGDLYARMQERVYVESPQIMAEPVTEGFIEIREATGDDRLVTVVEVLSPANKASGEGRRQYRRKQRDLQQARVNLVEIDLLRGGRWSVLAARERLPKRLQKPYRISVFRGWRPLALEFYHAPLRERLPAIRLPLRPGDADVALDIQALVDRSYQFGRYERTDYAAEPEPPLSGDDAAWADALLRGNGLRQ